MSDFDQVAVNLATIRARIDAVCADQGRDPGSVRLLPVSKTMPGAAITAAYDAGYRRFGENRVQEAYAKWQELGQYPDLEWAVIGHLQTNKAKFVAEFAHEFQALDSLELAAELQKRLEHHGRQLDVLIQVNSSDEPQKFGLAPCEVPAFAAKLAGFDRLRVRGLMTLALFSAENHLVDACFARMVELRDKLRDRDGGGWAEMSMGMSGDFELAIRRGATCVRVGQAIFGARLDPNKYWPGTPRS